MLVVTISFVGCKTATAGETTAAGDELFSLDDIPEISNKADLNTIVETGGVFDKMLPYIEKFTEKTGIKVKMGVSP